MKHFCTVADKNFLTRVIALDYSLLKYSSNYTLNLLYLDKDYLELKNNPNIKVHYLHNLLENDNILSDSQNNTPSREALHNAGNNIDRAKQIQFIWSLAPYFTNYCLLNIKNSDSILYIDSDIYFFDNWEKLYHSISNISIGLVEHRIKHIHNNGKYNVGIVYFKKDDNGIACSTLWKDLLLYTNHQFYQSHGGCGDQKYLELFEHLFNNVQSLDSFFGHLAPWNFNYHDYTFDNKVIWNNTIQDIMYCHFSNFQPDFINSRYDPAPRHGIIDISKNDTLKKIYDEYFNVLKDISL